MRGSGLFLGVELVQDRETLEPAAAEASDVVNRMRERGILIGTDGPFAQRPEDPSADAVHARERRRDARGRRSDEVLGR